MLVRDAEEEHLERHGSVVVFRQVSPPVSGLTWRGIEFEDEGALSEALVRSSKKQYGEKSGVVVREIGVVKRSEVTDSWLEVRGWVGSLATWERRYRYFEWLWWFKIDKGEVPK